jgi:hypothetical protein
MKIRSLLFPFEIAAVWASHQLADGRRQLFLPTGSSNCRRSRGFGTPTTAAEICAALEVNSVALSVRQTAGDVRLCSTWPQAPASNVESIRRSVVAAGDRCTARIERIGGAQALSHCRAVGMALASDARVLAVQPIRPRARIYVRLRRSDHALLRERADGRGVASATYVSMWFALTCV